ncbi:MAG: prepilin-type N-terminal cleavage/methylation domain-containing protein [bacterium]
MKSIIHGFTLIELLIVVAIIAIIAGIALVNFNTAQTRSKVTRVKSDLQALATAVESYHLDENTYPIHISITPYIQNGVFGHDTCGSDRFDVLTTPIAYITSIPKDPFWFVGTGGSYSSGLGYFLYTWDQFDTGDKTNGPFTDIYYASNWALRSKGPDGVWYTRQYPWLNTPSCVEGDLSRAIYDPINGTNSSGDIYRTNKNGQL